MPAHAPDEAVLLGAGDRAAASVARQFSLAGFKVTVVDWIDHPLKHSRHVDEYLRLSRGDVDVDRFAGELSGVLSQRRPLFALPTTDDMLEVCARHREEFSRHCLLLGVNPPEIHRYAHDKHQLHLLCRELGVPVPRFVLVSDLDELRACLPTLRYPLIAKPACSRVIRHNRLFVFAVRRIGSEAELVDYVRENVATVPIMLQEVLRGHGAGFNVLSCEGKVLDAYAHERLREAFGGGQSTYRRTIPQDTFGLRELGTRIIRRIGWSGVAMIEFKVQDGIPHVMEMNGRFWGSLELGIFAGVNLPLELVETFVRGRVERRVPSSRVVYARNFHNELISAAQGVVRDRSIRPVYHWLRTLPRALSPDEIVEDSPLRDFAFRVGMYGDDLRRGLLRIDRKLRTWRVRLDGRLPDLHDLGGLGGLGGTVGTGGPAHVGTPRRPLRVAFLCKGNICRSPFAEGYARRVATGHPGWSFASFGTHPQQDRMSPIHALSAALELGVDLSTHRSRRLTAETAREMDVLLVMDRENWVDVAALPGAAFDPRKVYFLGGEHEVPDPLSRDLASYRAVYRQIARRIDALFCHGISTCQDTERTSQRESRPVTATTAEEVLRGE